MEKERENTIFRGLSPYLIALFWSWHDMDLHGKQKRMRGYNNIGPFLFSLYLHLYSKGEKLWLSASSKIFWILLLHFHVIILASIATSVIFLCVFWLLKITMNLSWVDLVMYPKNVQKKFLKHGENCCQNGKL